MLITNLMHWLLFIHKILLSSTCFELKVLIFRRIQLYTCSIWYCHCSWWPVGTQLEWELCTILLYMLRASSAHLQEDTVVYMQHMVLSQFVVACRYTAWVRTECGGGRLLVGPTSTTNNLLKEETNYSLSTTWRYLDGTEAQLHSFITLYRCLELLKTKISCPCWEPTQDPAAKR